jgi:peptide/nickel transport system permease protein
MVHIPNAPARAKAYPFQLSGGMRQRVSIAMALANDPEIIIADEPTTALDVTVQAEILRLLKELIRGKDVSLIFITHDFGVIGQLCDRVAVMYAGKVVEQGSVGDVLYDPRHPYTRRLIECVPKLGDPGKELVEIPGLPPAIDNLPDGCSFAPRCDLVLEYCRNDEITLETVGSGRKVRCLRVMEAVG